MMSNHFHYILYDENTFHDRPINLFRKNSTGTYELVRTEPSKPFNFSNLWVEARDKYLKYNPSFLSHFNKEL